MGDKPERFELAPVADRAARYVVHDAGLPGHLVEDYTQDALLWCITHPGRVSRHTDPDKLGWEIVKHLLVRAREGNPAPAPAGAPQANHAHDKGGVYTGGRVRRVGRAWLDNWPGDGGDPSAGVVARDMVNELGSHDATLLGRYVVFGYTQEDLAGRYGVSRSTVHRRLVDACRKLLGVDVESCVVQDGDVCAVPGGGVGDDEGGGSAQGD